MDGLKFKYPIASGLHLCCMPRLLISKPFSWRSLPQQLQWISVHSSRSRNSYLATPNMESAATIGSGIDIRPSSIPGGGNGLWTARPFRRNELITEYCGPIIDHKKALRLRRLHRHSHIRVLNCQFMYIDGIKQPKAGAGGASFANDARDTAQNNAVFVCRHDNKLGRDRVYLKAVRDLPPGTEVFVGYGRDYWRNSRQPAAAAPKDQQASSSGSDSDSGEGEGDQQEQAGSLSLSSDEEHEQQQQQQQRTRYRARQQQQQRRCQQQQQQAEVQQSQLLQELPKQADIQQQLQQQQPLPGLLVSMGQGQWDWVGPGLTQPYAGMVPLGGQPAQHPYMQQAAGDWHHPSTLSHMLPHLHQQPVQDAAEAAALPVAPWQVAAALAAPFAQQRRQQQQQQQHQQQSWQGPSGSESAADTHCAGISISSHSQSTRQQRASVSAYKQQQQQQHSWQGSFDSHEAECSKDGGGCMGGGSCTGYHS